MSHINTELFISRRISSRKGGRENIMVRIATLTVAVGMAVMILALAVVTGFKREVTAKLVGFGSHVRIVSLHSNASLETDPVTVDTALMESVARLPRFASVAPYAVKGGMIKTPGSDTGRGAERYRSRLRYRFPAGTSCRRFASCRGRGGTE